MINKLLIIFISSLTLIKLNYTDKRRKHKHIIVCRRTVRQVKQDNLKYNNIFI